MNGLFESLKAFGGVIQDAPLQELGNIATKNIERYAFLIDALDLLEEEDKIEAERKKIEQPRVVYQLVCKALEGNYIKSVRTRESSSVIVKKERRDALTIMNVMERDRKVVSLSKMEIERRLRGDIRKAYLSKDPTGAFRDLSLRAQNLWVRIMKNNALGLKPPQSSYKTTRINPSNPYGYDTGEFVTKFIRWEFVPHEESQQLASDYRFLTDALKREPVTQLTNWRRQLDEKWRDKWLQARDEYDNDNALDITDYDVEILFQNRQRGIDDNS